MKFDKKSLKLWLLLGIIAVVGLVVMFWFTGKIVNWILPLGLGFIAGKIHSKIKQRKKITNEE